MFSSIASFLFGSSTAATATNCETNREPTDTNEQGVTVKKQQQQQQQQQHPRQLQRRRQSRGQRIIAEDEEEEKQNTIHLTSVTPSVVAGAGGSGSGGVSRPAKRGKNKRNSRRNKRAAAAAAAAVTPAPKLTQLLTPNETDDDFDEDDWFIVEKEDENESLPRTDSEEEFSIENKPNSPRSSTPVFDGAARQQQQRQRQQHQQQHISSHSQYNGPRPQQQRNRQQRARNNAARNNLSNGSRRSSGGNVAATAFSRAALSPTRSLQCNSGSVPELADAGLMQSLYIVSGNQETGHNVSGASSDSNGSGTKLFTMVDSWYVTPPPCFTSIGPVNVVTSPFENLLIEHPSMSVYHSIRSAQEAADSFVNLDLGVKESQQQEQLLASDVAMSQSQPMREATPQPPSQAVAGRNSQAAAGERSTGGPRLNRYTADELKQELFARNTQKCRIMKERQNLCRGALKRANKVRDYQSKGNRQRRADMQHCKIISGANNNRKCCF